MAQTERFSALRQMRGRRRVGRIDASPEDGIRCDELIEDGPADWSGRA
jgi:hypothetical protein